MRPSSVIPRPRAIASAEADARAFAASVGSTKPVHGLPQPKDVPSDMVTELDEPCDFRVGDEVIYTNDAGLKFQSVVKGFRRNTTDLLPLNTVYIYNDCWWFPHKLSDLSHPEVRRNLRDEAFIELSRSHAA